MDGRESGTKHPFIWTGLYMSVGGLGSPSGMCVCAPSVQGRRKKRTRGVYNRPYDFRVMNNADWPDPNRNYTATVWAENGAGRSKPVVFSEQCVTNYAQPDTVDPPASLPQNGTAFGLSFNGGLDETNGPVACYYVAVVPLSPDVAIESLPPPDSLVVDTFVKAMNNNLQQEHIVQNIGPDQFDTYRCTAINDNGDHFADIVVRGMRILLRFLITFLLLFHFSCKSFFFLLFMKWSD
ncbi:unnamed protein product [Toxocara canis]|uniref:Fibronectin type-III domain-containing protein n=1 Tax=Toxocara canis TaxID=6265 RepID=A0A183VGJ5_TOXCA|nr:unnamed protein product [Toxocara canis]